MCQCDSLILEHDISSRDLIQASFLSTVLSILPELVKDQASQIISWLEYLPGRMSLVLFLTLQHMLVGKALE